jgi:hypothetical protein
VERCALHLARCIAGAFRYYELSTLSREVQLAQNIGEASLIQVAVLIAPHRRSCGMRGYPPGTHNIQQTPKPAEF